MNCQRNKKRKKSQYKKVSKQNDVAKKHAAGSYCETVITN